MTVGELCAVCRNWFVKDVVRGSFSVRHGVLCEIPGTAVGQYVRIVGSRANDGVYRYPAGSTDDGTDALCDEEFDGAVWLMAPPPEFLRLCRDITAWEEKAGAALDEAAQGAASPYRSESFGGYEYVRRDGIGDLPADWRDERLGFASRLSRWRKV